MKGDTIFNIFAGASLGLLYALALALIWSGDIDVLKIIGRN